MSAGGTKARGAPKPTAKSFLASLRTARSAADLKKYERYFPLAQRHGDVFLGVRMGTVFALAKAHLPMEPDEIEKLLESRYHEARAGALSVMGKQHAHRATTDERREELYALALRRTDRIRSWDLVDLAGLYVVGPHLATRPRAPLAKLARSKDPYERRLAIVATGPILRQGEVEDTFRIAKRLAGDEEDTVQKGVGWMLRSAGAIDPARLRAFLDAHAARMPRVMLRYAIEKLPKGERARYLETRTAPGTLPRLTGSSGRARRSPR